MKNHKKGFSPESAPAGAAGIAPQEEAALRSEFEIMQRLDFAFIRELEISSAEEYIAKVSGLGCSVKDSGKRKRKQAKTNRMQGYDLL